MYHPRLILLHTCFQEASQSSMMDLEIADYERTVQALNTKVSEKDAEITELKTEIERLEGRTKVLQEQIGKIHWGFEIVDNP